MSQKRQPKGIPIGGQFASNSHDEAVSSLGSGESDRYAGMAFPNRQSQAHLDFVSSLRSLSKIDDSSVGKVAARDAALYQTYGLTDESERLADLARNLIGARADREIERETKRIEKYTSAKSNARRETFQRRSTAVSGAWSGFRKRAKHVFDTITRSEG